MPGFLTCRLCQKETVYLVHLCPPCTRVRHLLSIYGDSVYQVLEDVLVRNKKQQNYKITKIKNKGLEVKDDIEVDYKSDLNESSELYKNINDNMIKELKTKFKKN